jgi:hypothetical protein
MHVPKRVNRLYATTAGYYSHVEGARYIDPLVTGAKFPQLVELHEAQHEYLALANATDSIGRLYAGVLDWGSKELRKEHLNAIQQLFSAIHGETMFVHEVIATYVSFVLFYSRDPQGVAAARQQLPKFYEEALSTAERSFGRVGDERLRADMIGVPVWCAIAALNIPYPTGVSCFDRIPACIAFIRKWSPNDRFRMILGRVRPAWEVSSIFHDLSSDAEDSDLQAAAFDRIREAVPTVAFFSHHERPTFFRDEAAAVIADSQKYGYRFLEGRIVQPHPEDSAVQRLGTRIELPGLRPEEPLDYSLVRLRYARGTLEELESTARICASTGRRLFAHAFVLPSDGTSNDDERQAGVVCFGTGWHGGTRIVPYVANAKLGELLEVLRRVPLSSVVVKVDERWGNSVAVRLSETGQPVFVLAHDPRPQNIVVRLRNASAAQVIKLSHVRLTDDGYSVLMVNFTKDGYWMLSPITALRLELIENEIGGLPNIEYTSSEEEVLRLLPLDHTVFSELVATCFDPRTDFEAYQE